jgi:hypothetical protein
MVMASLYAELLKTKICNRKQHLKACRYYKEHKNYQLIKKWYGGGGVMIVTTLLKIMSMIKQSSKRCGVKCIHKT